MKQIKFYNNGNTVRVIDYDSDQITDQLKPAIYSVGKDMAGFFLSYVKDRFELPKKIYGSTEERADRVLRAYDSRSQSTGVMMTGDKGSGKTLLSSILCNRLIDRGLPVILIESKYSGAGFYDLLENLGDAPLFFDEFGKVFSQKDSDGEERDDQNSLLGVFDGARSKKRLILVTENETFRINDFMKNRPGRMFFHFRYQKLEEDLVREYCEDKDVPQDIINSILFRIEASSEFSFDSLKAVIEEYLRCQTDIEEIFSVLNIEQIRENEHKLKVLKVIDADTKVEYKVLTEEIRQPFNVYGSEYITYVYEVDEEGNERTRNVNPCVNDLVERSNDKFVYHCEERRKNLIVICEKVKEIQPMNYSRYIDL